MPSKGGVKDRNTELSRPSDGALIQGSLLVALPHLLLCNTGTRITAPALTEVSVPEWHRNGQEAVLDIIDPSSGEALGVTVADPAACGPTVLGGGCAVAMCCCMM